MSDTIAGAQIIADKLSLIQKTLETQNELLRKLIEKIEQE